MQERLLKEPEIRKAETVLAKGDRVELIPVKDGVKVVRIRRETVELGRKMLDGFLEGMDRKK